MLLTITTTRQPATDLGFLLHKHPDRVQSFRQPSGQAHVFYPAATADRCTAALLLEVDPVGLVRGRARGQAPAEGFTLGQYVNDRPYAASSLLAIALKDVFRTALTGRCDARPDLAAAALPLQISVPALPCRGGADLLTRVFEPLGWQVRAAVSELDPQFPQWGKSRYLAVMLTGEQRLATALNHLYVLLPVLDDAKHYWVAPDEIEKLLRSGEGWLAGHPEKVLIARRYLAHKRSFADSALKRLEDDLGARELDEKDLGEKEEDAELPVARKAPLAEQRRDAVLAALAEVGAARVLDLGCGGGALLTALIKDGRFSEIVGCDVSAAALDQAARRLRLDRMPERQRDRVKLWQSALTYRDDRLAGYDAAVLMEVIEHVDPPRLPALEASVFGHAKPRAVVVTTPNVEYNVHYEGLTGMRHSDHRFEWTRAEFREWGVKTADRYGYAVSFRPVGEEHETTGAPTQLAIFTAKEVTA